MSGEHTNKPAHGTEDLISRLREWTGQESICTCADLAKEAADCLEEVVPFLRARAQSCEACEGAGENIVGSAPDDYWSEPCEHCKAIWDLIERIEPKRVAVPVAIPLQAAQEEEDDITF